MTSTWTPHALLPAHEFAVPAGPGTALSAHLHTWDPSPVAARGGGIARLDDLELWMALSAPAHLLPEDRHHHARLHLFGRTAQNTWRDLGPFFPDGTNGSRQWSGCAVFDQDSRELHVHYTDVGHAGETQPTFCQRLVETTSVLGAEWETGSLVWSAHRESVAAIPPYLQPDHLLEAGEHLVPFRDPAWFHDPRTGLEHLLFAGAVPGEKSPIAAAVGLATRAGDTWHLQAPVLVADGVNRELERPHVVVHDGRYYLFVSSHGGSFNAELGASSGLYGFVADSLVGPYEPLNGTGLVACNPPARPRLAYAWWVLDDLSVASFLDYPEVSPGPLPADAFFVGGLAPWFSLDMTGAVARVRAAG